MAHPELSIIIVNWNGGDLLSSVVGKALRVDPGIERELILFDNASEDGSAEHVVDSFPQVRLLRSEVNLGFAGANNAAAGSARGEYLLLLNSDVELTPGCLEALLTSAKSSGEQMMLCPRLVSPEGEAQPDGEWQFPHLRRITAKELPAGVRSCDWITGACMLMQHTVWESLKGLDARRFFIYFEDTEFCWRAQQQGVGMGVVEGALAIHLGGGSSRHLPPWVRVGIHARSKLSFLKTYPEPLARRALGAETRRAWRRCLEYSLRLRLSRRQGEEFWEKLRHACVWLILTEHGTPGAPAQLRIAAKQGLGEAEHMHRAAIAKLTEMGVMP